MGLRAEQHIIRHWQQVLFSVNFIIFWRNTRLALFVADSFRKCRRFCACCIYSNFVVLLVAGANIICSPTFPGVGGDAHTVCDRSIDVFISYRRSTGSQLARCGNNLALNAVISTVTICQPFLFVVLLILMLFYIRLCSKSYGAQML